ncbi:prephenate dehydratase [Granulicoccus phenolivorans]|uniref:prephenate dehydratase n=1 Tax=Granulicoccus phenolivorans TaxID=266854 RepID=UPI000405D012
MSTPAAAAAEPSRIPTPTEQTFGYLGPAGTFCHQALLTLDTAHHLRPYASVTLALDAVRAGQVAGALVPIENSVEGGVSATIDNLTYGERLMITREVVIPVQFNLCVRPGTKFEDIKHVLTHPHAAAQCRLWLARELPHAALTEGGSTAGAAEEVADPNSKYDAAICAGIAGDMYHLDAIRTGIADNLEASTRFVLVTRVGAPPAPTGADKTTLVVFMQADHSGALLDILQQFSTRGVNLTRLESRPTRTTLGSYSFSFDAEGHIADARIADTLMGLRRTSKDVIFLGSYPRADQVSVAVGRGFTDDDYADARAWLESLRHPRWTVR